MSFIYKKFFLAASLFIALFLSAAPLFADTPAAPIPALPNTYDNADSKFSINYPSNWEYDAKKGIIIFSGKKDTSSYYSTVSVQTVLSKKNGGDFSSVTDFMADIKKQLKTESPYTTFVASGPYTKNQENGMSMAGEFLVCIYSYKNQIFEQWQIVLMRADHHAFYFWAYTAPVDRYRKDLATAKAMLDTLVIH